jgi:hypothetical protein
LEGGRFVDGQELTEAMRRKKEEEERRFRSLDDGWLNGPERVRDREGEKERERQREGEKETEIETETEMERPAHLKELLPPETIWSVFYVECLLYGAPRSLKVASPSSFTEDERIR